VPIPFLKHMSNTLFIGKVYHRFDELPSTNDWAAQIIASGKNTDGFAAAKTKPPEGTVVRAANQTAGRGQLGSQWHSSAGKNLLLSIILYPPWLEVKAQFYLSMAVALALRDLAASFVEDSNVQVKWPNDLYLQDKKAAGILIQNTISGSNLQNSIIGIGLNVNQLEFSSDLPNASSLALMLGEDIDLEMVADKLFECVEQRYLQLKSGQRAAIKSAYESSLWRIGAPHIFERSVDNTSFEGTILGVTEAGLLLLQTSSGQESFELKTIRFKT
jgi:BirA family biotin operon repressor/biotin-[acetyl-CoA-carboxylase] ligase